MKYNEWQTINFRSRHLSPGNSPVLKVGLIVVATGKYVRFAQPLYHSMLNYFFNGPGQERKMFLLTNGSAFSGPVILPARHEAWPFVALKKYELIANNWHAFVGMDYLYLCDADMRFVNRVGREILGDLVATVHPSFWNAPRERFTYERNPASTAYVPFDQGNRYYAAAFVGGKAGHFLEMAQKIAANINIDLNNGQIAVWHDESHLNRYLIDNPPTLTLNPSYCFPEAAWAQDLPFPKIIMALDKNHSEIRNL